MKKNLFLLTLLLLLGGCKQQTQTSAEPTLPATNSALEPTVIMTEAPATLAPTGTPVAEAVATATEQPISTPTPEAVAENGAGQSITILYTNDEHGWMEGIDEGRGSAELFGLWLETQPCMADGSCLVLSGGDMWTGPAISTWFNGESMVEVMNAMGYRGAAVGNHEFDLGLENLQERAAQMNFPLLSANLRDKATGGTPERLGVLPYAVFDFNGIKIGLVGLTTQRTTTTTDPANITDFDFIGYETALREMVPRARADGAQLIFVPAHICSYEIDTFVAAVQDLNIQMIGGGHCNELISEQAGETVVLIGGHSHSSYAWATFELDVDANVVGQTYGTEQNNGGSAESELTALVSKWRAAADVELDVVIGYLDQTLSRKRENMQNLITYSWLWGYPSADFAVTNLGGMRADWKSGEVTLADIITVLPFNNVLIEVQLTGAQINQIFSNRADMAVAGMYRSGGELIDEATGAALETERSYSVLISDFMYAGGDELEQISQFDPEGYDTAIDWRQPIIDWIIEQESTADAGLNAAIESLPNH